MYERHFGLQREPFSIAPDPRLLYMSERHREALAHLLYGVGGGGGFVVLTGEVGTGKTTVCRAFLEQVPPRCRVAYIFNPALDVIELLRTVCAEFRVPVAAADGGVHPTRKDHVDALNEYLLRTHAAGFNNVLVIDEAQALAPAVLEQLRLLTNLETNERKLLQIVLIGQPELRALLARPEMQQLAQRVIARYHLEPLGAPDLERLYAFARAHCVQWWLQPGGPETVHRLDEAGPELAYMLPEFSLVMPFRPTDFTQVNHAINRVLVSRAVRLLDVQPGDRVIDWFCGLGNFTLPLATRAREVWGIEGSEALVQRARDNAARNGLAHRTRFVACNLFELDAEGLAVFGTAERWLVDPPREGALALVKALVDLEQRAPAGWAPPRRIVYVSCNPATLARDAGLLVHQGGWRCSAAGVVNMFPHTAHVESMAVFDRP